MIITVETIIALLFIAWISIKIRKMFRESDERARLEYADRCARRDYFVSHMHGPMHGIGKEEDAYNHVKTCKGCRKCRFSFYD